MELSKIQEAIRLWIDSGKNKELIKSLFANNHNAFQFKYTQTTNTTIKTFLHVYLAIVKDPETNIESLRCFAINSDKDTKAVHERGNMANYISEYSIISDTPPEADSNRSDTVPREQALKRINNWITERNEWIDYQIDTNIVLFQIFVIPTHYLKKGTDYRAYFALHKKESTEPSAVSNLKGDMIVWDMENKNIVYPPPPPQPQTYYNTIRLVPPFGDTQNQSTRRDNFFLYKLVTGNN
ncbi:hypothetical protein [Pontimicrobium sp. MEBiC01747]